MNAILWYVVDLTTPGDPWKAVRRGNEKAARDVAEEWARRGISCAVTRLVACYEPAFRVDEVGPSAVPAVPVLQPLDVPF